jgi:2-haloacid dehalogenase
MLIDRRAFLSSAVGAAVALGASQESESRSSSTATNGRRIKAIAFDGFPIIDPRPVASRAEEMFPGRGESLSNAWRTRQFEYTWLRTVSSHYVDFWQTTQDALVFAANSLGLALTPEARESLMHAYLELKAWPDAIPALESLRAAGVRMAFLSNFTMPMLDAAVANSGLQGFFESHLSTDRVRAYKPDPRAYEMGLKAFRVPREEIVFCASAAWDAAGAKWFGYRTFWVNRSHQPAEELGVKPDGMGEGMAELAKFVLAT